MLKRLITAIAQLLGVRTQPTEASALLMRSVGPVSQEPTTPAGNKRSARATKPRKSSPAQPRTPKKPKAVQSTTAVAKSTSKKQKPAQMARSRKEAGSCTPTPVRKTRQHAK